MRKGFTFFVSCLLLLVMMFSVVGCGGGGSSNQGSQGGGSSGGSGEPAAPKLPNMLSIGTHAIGSLFNSMGSGLATVCSKNTPMEVKAIATSGPVEWLPMFHSKEIDMGVLNAWDARMGWLGQSDYETVSRGKGFPVRLVTNGSPSVISAIVAADSGINTAQDLKGKNFVLNYAGSAGLSAQARSFLASHNMSAADVQAISVPGVADGVNMIIERRADCTGTANIGFALLEELEATRGAKYLSYDPSPEAEKRAQAEFPGFIVLVEPGPGNTGVREPTYMYTYENYLIARTDISEDAVYAIVKALWENYDELATIHPRLALWKPDTFVTELATVPYHPGAIKFYKEQGVWTDKMEAVQKERLAEEK